MDIKSGDILYFKANNFFLKDKIQAAVGEEITHVGIAYDIVLNEANEKHVRTLEATTKGIVMGFYKVSDLEKNNILIGRHSQVEEIKMRKVIWNYYCKRFKEGTLAYDWLGMTNAVINAILDIIIPDYEKGTIIPNKNIAFCSEMVAEIYKEYGIDLGIQSDSISPTDIFRIIGL